MKKKGLASILVIIVIVIVVVLFGAIFYYRHLAVAPTVPITTLPASVPTSTVASLNPMSGPVGTTVTIHGAGFGSDNAIEMNDLTNGAMKNVASPDGQTLSFQIPSTLGPNCKSEICAQFLLDVTPNVYKISVITGSSTQDIGNFMVTTSTTTEK